MSLMSILKSSDPKCKEVKEIIKSVAPKKTDFKTYSGILKTIDHVLYWELYTWKTMNILLDMIGIAKHVTEVRQRNL